MAKFEYVHFGSVVECHGCGANMMSASVKYVPFETLTLGLYSPEHMIHTCSACGWSYKSQLLKQDKERG